MSRPFLAIAFGAAVVVSAPSMAAGQGRAADVSLDSVRFAAALEVDLTASKRVARGLYTRDLITGDGRWAQRGDEITVRYAGALADGRAFTAPSESPVTFKLGARTVIEGWERGLSGMRVGGRRQLIIAPALGYGAKESGLIPPNSVLVFEVELLSIR